MAKKVILALSTAIVVFLLSLVIGRSACDPANGKPSMTVYGQVVDQDGHPVAAATVDFEASYVAGVVPFYDGNYHHWNVHAVSAADGTFIVRGGRGDILSCESITKPGFPKGLLDGPFCFGGGSSLPRYHPDPNHPVQFMLWNDAFRHVLSKRVVASVDGQLHTFAYRDLRVKSELGGADFSFVIVKPESVPATPFDWRLILHGVDSDLQECSGQLGSEAPATGYVRDLSVAMSAHDPHWSNEGTLRFYTRSDRGEVYASVEMHVSAGEGQKNSDITIAYRANFGGSRDVVPGPVTPEKK